jgi:hypothetical protein
VLPADWQWRPAVITCIKKKDISRDTACPASFTFIISSHINRPPQFEHSLFNILLNWNKVQESTGIETFTQFIHPRQHGF